MPLQLLMNQYPFSKATVFIDMRHCFTKNVEFEFRAHPCGKSNFIFTFQFKLEVNFFHTTWGHRIMGFHINLNALNLDAETSARIGTKISSLILAEIAHLDLSETTAIIGKLGPGTRGYIAVKNLDKLSDIANHEAMQNL